VARNNTRNNELYPEQTGDNPSPALTVETFEAAVAATPESHFSATLQVALDLQEAMTTLQTVLKEYLAEQAPSFGPAFDALDNIIRFLDRHVKGSPPSLKAAPTVPLGQPAKPPSAFSAPSYREQAIRQLQEIAAFFRHSEPHSPVAYLADQAARWGNMPLHEWLRNVVRDEAVLAHVEELLGVKQRLKTDDN
jgi:type VI secretion system protein ImpA